MTSKRDRGDELAADSVHTLRHVKRLQVQVEKDIAEKRLTPKELGYEDVFQVSEMTSVDVADVIEKIGVKAMNQIMSGKGVSFSLPNRAGNHQYIPQLDANFLELKHMVRSFDDQSQVKKVAIMARIAQCIHELCVKGIHVTKRDLFYTDVKLFEKQGASDVVLEEMSCMVGCTRSSLHVMASEKGVVVGKLQFRDDGDLIDCSLMGVSGKNIPSFMDRVSDIRSSYTNGGAQFILLVEKDAAFMRLAEDRFYNKYPCIIITGKGEADLATRMFVKRVREVLKIPVLGLFDSDAHGLKILSVYMQGSESMSHDAASLATPDIKWLGVRPSDLEKYNIPEQCRLDLTEADIKFAKSLLEKDYVKRRKEWVDELNIMLRLKKKAEIQALSSFGFQYLSNDFLPRKLREADWA